MDRFEGNRRGHERRASQRRAADGGRSLACDAAVLWRSSSEILDYSVEAADGALGRIEDFCVEEESSMIIGLVICGQPGLGRISVPLSAIERIDWSERKVYLQPAALD